MKSVLCALLESDASELLIIFKINEEAAEDIYKLTY